MMPSVAVARPIEFARRLALRTRDTSLARTAGSLAFTTLLGLVPLATVAITFAARFPMFQEWLDALESYLLQFMLPGSANAVVHTYIREFTEKAARLTGLSIAFIVIWGITQRRPFARRVVVFALGTTVGPVLVGASISVTTWLLTKSLAAVPLRTTLAAFVVKPLPWVFSTLALALLYVTAPNRQVPWRNAFAGAVAAALAFEGAKYGFAFYLTHVPTYELVYGALAALPVFLIWIYFCWLIVLTGAAITATLTLPPVAAPERRAGARRS
jgi:membrane protein